MDFLFYGFASAVYVMTIHFALAIRNQFNLWLMAGIFVFGALIGWYFHSLEIGFVLSIVLSLIFW